MKKIINTIAVSVVIIATFVFYNFIGIIADWGLKTIFDNYFIWILLANVIISLYFIFAWLWKFLILYAIIFAIFSIFLYFDLSRIIELRLAEIDVKYFDELYSILNYVKFLVFYVICIGVYALFLYFSKSQKD